MLMVMIMNKSFRYYIRSEDTVFKYALGPSDETGREFHDFYELILFLGGEAELISEHLHTPLAPGNLLVIPKETYHQVRITGAQEDYLRCTLSFYQLPQGFRLFGPVRLLSCDSELDFLFQKLQSCAQTCTPHASNVLQAVTTLLLCRLDTHTAPIQNITNLQLHNILMYIHQHIGEKLTLGGIAKANHLSESSLSHLFKEALNISVYQYILKKRLSLARQRISTGESAVTAAAECGFRDYSGFYRQYKKAFHRTPSE